MAKEELCTLFKKFSISQKGLRKHMIGKIPLSLKDSHLYTISRDAKRTLNLRFNIVIARVDFQT